MRCLVCNHGYPSSQIRPHLLWLGKQSEAGDINAYWSAKRQEASPDEVLKLSSAPVHYRSHVPQIGAVVHLANYHVALCVHVMETVGDAAMTRPRKGKMMMGTQLI